MSLQGRLSVIQCRFKVKLKGHSVLQGFGASVAPSVMCYYVEDTSPTTCMSKRS